MHNKGFTLLEVLIVVIIIGLLAAIAVPQYMTVLKKSKAGEAYTNLGTLRTSVERYYYDQIAAGTTYAALLDATWLGNLDIEFESANWTYTIKDSSSADGINYVITAVNDSDSTIWVQIDEQGVMTKSEVLGGTGTKVDP